MGTIAFAAYPGADAYSVYPVPVPYVRYRGRFLRADDDGVRGLLVTKEFAEVNISAGGTAPVRSSATTARAGMPDLKATFELGPSLDIHLWRSVDRRTRLDLDLPVRSAWTLEWPPRAVGWVSSPRIDIERYSTAPGDGWRFDLEAGPNFATRAYNAYYYDVAPSYATTDRPSYQAHDGFGGSEVAISMSKRFASYWVGALVAHDWLAGASFFASPLVRSSSSWSMRVGIAWIIGRSSTRVDVEACPPFKSAPEPRDGLPE